MAAAVLAWLPTAAAAQIVPAPPALPEANATSFSIFIGGRPLGSEQIAVNRVADGWLIASTGRIAAPIDVVARRLQVRYTADWRPLSFDFDGTQRGVAQTVHTSVEGTNASSNVTVAGQTTRKSDAIDPNALLVLATNFFAPYEAVAARVKTAAAGTDIPAYAEGPMISFMIRVGESAPEQIQTTARLVTVRRTALTMVLPGSNIDATIWTDDLGRLVRFNVPGQSLDVVREDIAAVSSRTVTISRPNDERVTIPGNGFTLAGTISRPTSSTPARMPAVVLVGGSGPIDRDSLVFGVPVLGEIAGSLAEAGIVSIRYDKRGVGQSGGRAESATLTDYAEDARAAVRFLADRKDVDPKRIAILGHSEGGLVALIAADKEKRIAAVVLIATPGMRGTDVILAQQQRALDGMKLSPEERQAKVDEQKKINDAVVSGNLSTLPANVRRVVDNGEVQSLFTADPEKLLKDVRQPILIVQGELDAQVEPKNADLLEAMAKKRKNGTVDVVKAPGVNHLLTPATTGDVAEYGSLRDKHVAASVTQPIATWLQKTLSTAR
jgi:alpha-beta hydrolase superfamily lysophospholipase